MSIFHPTVSTREFAFFLLFNVNQNLRGTLALYPWSRSLSWCLTESCWNGDHLHRIGPCRSEKTLLSFNYKSSTKLSVFRRGPKYQPCHYLSRTWRLPHCMPGAASRRRRRRSNAIPLTRDIESSASRKQFCAVATLLSADIRAVGEGEMADAVWGRKLHPV